MIIISCYISSRSNREYFAGFLDELGDVIRDNNGFDIIIGGDFNAKSPTWNPSTYCNFRGTLLEEWAAERDLRLINIGETPTSVNPRGTAVVDLTWVTANLADNVVDWCVHLDDETLSDHNYIRFRILVGGKRANRNELYNDCTIIHPRWNYNLMDYEMLTECMEWECIVDVQVQYGPNISADCYAQWIDRVMIRACDMSAPRAGKSKRRKNAHWWNASIANLRKNCIKAKRALTKFNRNNRRRSSLSFDDVIENNRRILYSSYKAARKELRDAIRNAKLNAWKDLLASIDSDPWGRPYLLVLGRLRRSSPGLTEILEDAELGPLLDSLFPSDSGEFIRSNHGPFERVADMEVRPAEVLNAIWKKKYSNTAPGLDGIRSLVWRKAPRGLRVKLAECFTLCLENGVFPRQWKQAGLVLIPKAGGNFTTRPIKARPICLLSVTGKVFERVITERLLTWMEENRMSQLSAHQFGFRQGRSTYDALLRFTGIVGEALRDGDVAVAVSIDITNAFNSVPFNHILAVLSRKGFPDYLIGIICDYFCDRVVEYTALGGHIMHRKVCAGVPQGSVLGPLLWNIAYNEVLESRLEPGCFILGYADDTLIVTTTRKADVACIKANMQIATVMRRIQNIGLSVAAAKTEVILFHRGRRTEQNLDISVRVDDVYIKAGSTLKYLGVIFDSALNFGEHFKYVAAKASKVARSLGRLMPNLRGPSEPKRILYANTIMSVMMYGAPIWCDAMAPVSASARRRQAPVLRVQRFIAMRVCSAYRSVSLEAAILLARIPPVYLLACYYRRVYTRVRDLKNSGNWTPQEDREIRQMERLLLYRQWKLHLDNGINLSGLRVRTAVYPSFSAWMDHPRDWGMSFHLTQILTGHGCFNEYLHRIGRELSPSCYYCGNNCDSAQHTLAECHEWAAERAELCVVVGNDLSLSVLVKAMLDSLDKWKAVVHFVNTIMLRKEDDERARRTQALVGVGSGTDSESDGLSPPMSPESSSPY